jgi:diadenylate cyclase
MLESLIHQIELKAVLDIGLVATCIYWLFSLIRGTRAVTLVIGVSVLLVVYAVASAIGLPLFTTILQATAVVGVVALAVVFQPELRRVLEQIGRVGSFGWLLAPTDRRAVEHTAHEIAHAAALLSGEKHGALIVLERETGLEEIAETGVMLHADLSAELLRTIFAPRTALHDGAVVIREGRMLAAGALLPLTETSLQAERFGTRHRAALGITEQTDALVVVVSEENGQMSLVERARIVRIATEAQLQRALQDVLVPAGRGPNLLLAGRGRGGGPGAIGGDRRLRPSLRFRARSAAAIAERATDSADDGTAAAAAAVVER